VGDAVIGADANLGAGTITANYDGENKYRTMVGDGVFTGVNTNLIAPVTVGEDAYTGAGSVVNKNVPAGKLAVGAPARAIRESPQRRRKRAQQGESAKKETEG
jgi:bifunctional UDP-N-acetylglucosamine pyrophosphorylase/glucosamine-1-phosphate N-acetyltransferase